MPFTSNMNTDVFWIPQLFCNSTSHTREVTSCKNKLFLIIKETLGNLILFSVGPNFILTEAKKSLADLPLSMRFRLSKISFLLKLGSVNFFPWYPHVSSTTGLGLVWFFKFFFFSKFFLISILSSCRTLAVRFTQCNLLIFQVWVWPTVLLW